MRPLPIAVFPVCLSLCLLSPSLAASDPVASPHPPSKTGDTAQAQKEGQTSSASGDKVTKSSQLIELEGAKGGEIAITMDTPLRRHFPIRVKSKDSLEIEGLHLSLRKNGETITAKVLPAGECTPGQNEKQPAVSEKTDSTSITLKPGEERRLEFCLDTDLSRGTYDGVLVFGNSNDKHVQEFDVTINNPYVTLKNPYLPEPNRYPKLLVFLLVFLGAVTSIFLTKFPPVSATRRANREKIMDLRERIRRLTAFERELGTKLTVELVKAETLNTNTKVFTPSASERLKTIDTLLKKLDEQLIIRQEISNLYVEIDSADYLPFSMEQQVRSLLREADQGLYMDRPDLAQAREKEAEGLLKCELSMIKKQAQDIIRRINDFLKVDDHLKRDAHMSGLCKDLAQKLSELLKELEVTQKGDDNPTELSKGLPPDIRERLKKKLSDAQVLADEKGKRDFLERMRDLDLAYNKAYIYHNCLLEKKNVDMEDEDLAEVDAEVLELIDSGMYKGLEEAQILIHSLGMGVTEKRIKDALSLKEFTVATLPSDPTVNNLVKFKVLFKADEINGSPLIKTSRFRCIWDFGDDTSRAEGDEVIHYFKRRGVLILFRKWVRRTLSVLRLRKAEWKRFSLSLDILSSDGTILVSRRQEIPVKEALDREYSSGITITAAMGFALTLLISSAIAMTTNYEETYSFKSLKDILAPFLLGFGLDISRDKLQETAKGYASKKRGA